MKNIVIAGGTSGIGLETARQLSELDNNVIITGRNKEKLEAVVNQYKLSNKSQALDHKNGSAIDSFFDGIGSIDHLVLSMSGGKGAGEFKDLNLNDLHEAFDGKFFAYVNTIQSSLKYINKNGSITLVTAISATANLPGTSGLGAVNGALESMVPTLAKELKPLRINAVSPGVIDTPYWRMMDSNQKMQMLQSFQDKTPVGRIGAPNDIARTILFLIQNTFITGSIIPCDGGIGL